MSTVDAFDRWIDDRAMYFADGSSEDPEPEVEPELAEALLERHRLAASRAINDLAESARAREADARANRDFVRAAALSNRADAYQHAATIVARFRR